MKGTIIKFKVDEDLKEEAEEYARAKGFGNTAALARVALVNYLARYSGRREKK